MRVNRYLAQCTGMSRRGADAAIAAGRVRIDGRPAGIGDQVDASSRVELDGAPVTPPTQLRYVAFNKPVGYVTSRVQQGNDPTMYELLPQELHALKPVGRLDRDSCGLILLTDDGALAQTLSHPSGGKTKRYRLRLNRPLREDAVQKLQAGVPLEDGTSRLTVLRRQGNEAEVALGEGRNRQIRRTLGALGYSIVELERTAFGPLELGNLAPGTWQPLNKEDLL